MTKLPVYAAAGAFALIASAWVQPASADPFAFYTPIPKTASQPPSYDPQAKPAAQQTSTPSHFGLYTPMPPTASDQNASRTVSQAPNGQYGDKTQ